MQIRVYRQFPVLERGTACFLYLFFGKAVVPRDVYYLELCMIYR